jgi:hypothetical protein
MCICVVDLIVSQISKCQHVSQHDSDIMMTCIDHHKTSLPPHLMIHIASTLLHPVSSVAPNLSLHFTTSRPHQPWAIP